MLLKNWLSNGLDSIAGAAYKALRSVCFSFATLIYRLIISLYNMFDIMCRGRILDNSVIKSLAQRVGLVLGIVMLFLVAFSFIRMLLDPELVTDKSKGAVSIIKKTILVIVMLGISNYFFQLLYSIQSAVVENHVVSKLLLPYSVDTDKFGGALSAELFVAFYDVDSNYLDSDGNISSTDLNVQLCQQEIWTMKERINTDGDFSLGNVCLNASAVYTAPDGNQREGFVIDFNWFLILVAGIFAAYTLVMYCIKLGIRMIQMAFLEIISPMAIISYLSPKQDNMFSKWSKIYFSTYIDIFLRIGIINFVVYLIAIVLGSGTDTTFWDSFGSGLSKGAHNFIEVVLVLSLLAFANKVPELLKDLFPAGASKLGLGGGLKMKDFLGLGALTGAVTGAGVGMVTAGLGRENGKLTGMLGGAITGLGRGAMAGRSGQHAISGAAKAQWGKMKEANTAYNDGATFSRRMLSKLGNTFTAGQTPVARLERQKAQLQREGNAQYKQNIDRLNRSNKSYQNVSNAKSKIKDLALKRLHSGKLDGLDASNSGANDILNYESQIAATKERLKNANPDDIAAISQLNSNLLEYQQQLSDATNTFVTSYYENATNAELDSYKSEINSEFSNNSDLYANQQVDTWAGVDQAGNYASAQMSANSSLLAEYQSQLDQVNDQVAELDRQIEAAKNDSGPIFGPPPGGGPPPGWPGGPPPRP